MRATKYIACRVCGWDAVSHDLAEKIASTAQRLGRKPAPHPCSTCGVLYDITMTPDGEVRLKLSQ